VVSAEYQGLDPATETKNMESRVDPVEDKRRVRANPKMADGGWKTGGGIRQ
jgi:hypothetical protein